MSREPDDMMEPGFPIRMEDAEMSANPDERASSSHPRLWPEGIPDASSDISEERAYVLPDHLMARLKGRRVIDSHAHIYPHKISEKASDSVGRFYGVTMDAPSGDSETLLRNGRRAGVTDYIVCSVATKVEQVAPIDEFISKQCEIHPGFIGLGTFHEEVEDVEALLDRTQELGLMGIKIHPDFQKMEIDDPRLMALYHQMEERGMVLLLHTGDDRYDYSAPERLVRVLERYDTLRVDAAHFGGYRVWERAYSLLRGSNAYFDTSSSLPYLEPEQALEMMRGYGMDRMMFGVDFPMWEHSAELGRLLSLDLSDEELDLVLHANCERLYGLGTRVR